VVLLMLKDDHPDLSYEAMPIPTSLLHPFQLEIMYTFFPDFIEPAKDRFVYLEVNILFSLKLK